MLSDKFFFWLIVSELEMIIARSIFRNGKSLSVLALTHSNRLNDLFLENIGQYAKKLSQIDISNCRRISPKVSYILLFRSASE